jgi:hypothetical protein
VGVGVWANAPQRKASARPRVGSIRGIESVQYRFWQMNRR